MCLGQVAGPIRCCLAVTKSNTRKPQNNCPPQRAPGFAAPTLGAKPQYITLIPCTWLEICGDDKIEELSNGPSSARTVIALLAITGSAFHAQVGRSPSSISETPVSFTRATNGPEEHARGTRHAARCTEGRACCFASSRSSGKASASGRV